MLYIYVYELVFNKYYVGITTDIKKIEIPENKWTEMYYPVRVLETYPDCDVFDLDKYTLKYMKEKGIDNVRGGSFSSVKLSDGQKQIINEMINGYNEEIEPIEIKIKEYFEIFNKVFLDSPEYLVESIEEFENIFIKIKELKQLIEKTNFVSMDDLPEINKEIEEHTKFIELHKKRKRHKLTATEIMQYNELCKKKFSCNSNDKNKTWISQIENCTNRMGCVVPVNHYVQNDLMLVALKIIDFNLSKKLELKNIYKKYHNDEFVRRILIELRKKHITKLKSSL